MPGAIEFLLNGRSVRIESPPPHRTLLDEIRDRGLTGAKEGCAEGECGTCTILMVAPHGAGSEYRGINSCLMLLPTSAGHEFYTVEALAAGGALAESQRVMAAAGGSQCGYCTPGFVMSLFAEHYRPGRDVPCASEEVGGNLCRCTGYRPISDALASLGPAPDDLFKARLSQAAPALAPVRVDGFSRPQSVDECVALLAGDPDAVLIAGGTDLAVEANLKGRRWRHLVSVEAIAELHQVAESPAGVRIGAAVSLVDMSRAWHGRPDAAEEWSFLFSSLTIRHRATLGGNLATASPIGDSAPLMLALDAVVDIAGPSGRRSVPLGEFFTGYRQTALQRGELIVSVTIGYPLPELVRFYKASKRRLDDISTVAAALAIDRDASGRIRRARFAFGGVAATPIRAIAAEQDVIGELWNEATAARARQAIERTLTPMTDHRGSKEYRLQVSASLIDKFWWETAGPEGPAPRV